MSVDTDIRWFDEVAQRLQSLEIKTKRIKLPRLHSVFAEVFAHRPGIPQRRDWLLKSLRHAERKGVIIFPKTAWDRMGEPALPRYVTRVLDVTPKDTWWKTYYWHPKLDWVADLNTLPKEHGEFLLRVQQGLNEGWFEQSASLNRRSVELTGKEKRLKQLFRTRLFAEGRLERKFLNVISDVMPLAHEFVGRNALALVFENKEPFNVARQVLQSIPHPPYGILAYGGGGSFQDSVRDFLRVQRSKRYQSHFQTSLRSIHYVGDLDWTGLMIAQGASSKAQQYGLPPLLPAPGIHRLMLGALLAPRINHPNGFPDNGGKRTCNHTLIEWLPKDTWDTVRRILDLGNRVPEELLTPEVLYTLWS